MLRNRLGPRLHRWWGGIGRAVSAVARKTLSRGITFSFFPSHNTARLYLYRSDPSLCEDQLTPQTTIRIQMNLGGDGDEMNKHDSCSSEAFCQEWNPESVRSRDPDFVWNSHETHHSRRFSGHMCSQQTFPKYKSVAVSDVGRIWKNWLWLHEAESILPYKSVFQTSNPRSFCMWFDRGGGQWVCCIGFRRV